MKAEAIIKKLETLSPLKYAEGWDNSGLTCGRGSKEVNTVMLAVDATDDVVEEAVSKKVDMLITHHPLIFKGIKNISEDDFIGRRLIKLIQNDIVLYAMHTNFDVMGMADEAAGMLKLSDTKVLEVTYKDADNTEGIGRIGRLPKSMTLRECAQYVKESFALSSVKVFGELDTLVESVAVSPGSGKGMNRPAITGGAQVLITGDIDHHEGIDSVAQGLCVVDAGHYGIEQIFVDYMHKYISQECDGIAVIKAAKKEPFVII